jgi:hypothetical protein
VEVAEPLIGEGVENTLTAAGAVVVVAAWRVVPRKLDYRSYWEYKFEMDRQKMADDSNGQATVRKRSERVDVADSGEALIDVTLIEK